MITIEKVNDTAGFKALKEDWCELQQASSVNCLFLTWEWLYTWWSHLGKDRQLYIIAVRQDGQLIALAPMAIRPKRFKRLLPFRVLEFLGTGNVGSDYLSILIRNGKENAAIKAVCSSLAETNLVVEMSHIERTSLLMVNLVLQFRLLGWQPARSTIEFCPYINLTGYTWDSYLASLGKSHRTNFRRKLRKLNESFDVSFEKVVTEKQRENGLATLLSLHEKRWSSHGKSNAFNMPELVEFHEEFTRLALQKNWLRLYALYLNSKPVAALYGFVYNKVFYYYQAGFDPAYAQYSVGLVSMGMAIKLAINEGLAEFDLLHGEEAYKYLWARDERELVKFDLYPPVIRGLIFKKSMQVRAKFKKCVWSRLPLFFKNILMGSL